MLFKIKIVKLGYDTYNLYSIASKLLTLPTNWQLTLQVNWHNLQENWQNFNIKLKHCQWIANFTKSKGLQVNLGKLVCL